MARSRCCNRLVLFPIMFGLPLLGCQCGHLSYTGTATLSEHPWLKQKKIFLDPGHGGDRCARPGPNGVSEPALNLAVAQILSDMLATAGADVMLSRTDDGLLSARDRAAKAREYRPDLLISISHSASPRRDDCVNYPVVFIWGSEQVQPASHDLAGHLIEEFNAISDEKGTIRSDFAQHGELGTTLLRETRDLCPGVIGNAGFYTDVRNSIRLKDRNFIEKEAEAYFFAISRYVKWGTPSAFVEFSCPVATAGAPVNLVRDSRPGIAIVTRSGNELPGIDSRSLRITLDGVPVSCREVSPGRFAVNYGKELYPGYHRLAFQFRNLRRQSSMILYAPFTVEMRAGDRDRLVKEGTKRIRSGRNASEGLKMLLAALSMGPVDPGCEPILRDISRGFGMIGDAAGAAHFARRLSLFYDLSSRDTAQKKNHSAFGEIIPIGFIGTRVNVVADACCEDKKREVTKNVFSDRIKQFFSGQE